MPPADDPDAMAMGTTETWTPRSTGWASYCRNRAGRLRRWCWPTLRWLQACVLGKLGWRR